MEVGSADFAMLSADESKTKSAIAAGTASDFWMTPERIGITQMSFVPPPAGNYIQLPSIEVEFFVQQALSTNFSICCYFSRGGGVRLFARNSESSRDST